MSIQTAAFITSLLFLLGVLIMLIGSLPDVRKRYPKLFLNGFGITLMGIVLMVIAAFVLT